MNSKIRILLAFAQLAALTTDFHTGIEPREFEPNMKKKEPPRPKNHRQFFIDGIEVWALSEKRAIEKVKKLKN